MIKHYQIEKLFECRITHECLAAVSFKMGDDDKALIHPLPTLEFAMIYLDKEARDWFLPCLENFINHKKHIITEAHPEQWKYLQNCITAYVAYEKMPTNKICYKFLKGYNHFVGILPHPNNASFTSSEHDLKELKLFCEEFLKFKPFSPEQ